MSALRPALIALAFGLLAAAPEAPDGAESLKGIWATTAVIAGGVRQPDDPTAGAPLTAFDGASYVHRRGTEIVEEGSYKVDPGAKPRSIDFVIEKGADAGKRQLGIYELGGDTLKVCLARPGATRRPTTFDTHGSTGLAVVVSRRFRP